MAVKQGITTYKLASNSNAKYKLKYTYSVNQTARNGIVTNKYSYSKLITILTGKKYSYSI